MQVFALALPSAPNIGFMITGCGVGIEAFASPILAAIIIPPLITTSGFTPKRAGFQITKSANLPTSKEPMTSEVPVAKAGLLVYLALYLFARKLSLSAFCSSGNLPRCFLFLSANCHVRVITSAGRPMAWESELIIEIAPISWRTSSAAMVCLRIRDFPNAISSGISESIWWQTINISKCSSYVLIV